jgi:hypothetical protein
MEKNPSWEADSHSDSQEIPRGSLTEVFEGVYSSLSSS